MTQSPVNFTFYLNQKEMISHLKGYVKALSLEVTPLGSSQNGLIINEYQWGKGEKKMAVWSQMHGNESTGTFCIYDVLESLKSLSKGEYKALESAISLHFIPMLNPDGADVYTRESANGMDLNRDSVDKSTPEIQLFWKWMEELQPDLALNLHDQRSRFSAGDKVATLSFLAPSPNEEREITSHRLLSMECVAFMYEQLKEDYSAGIGKYTDEFYPTATGDNLMARGIPNVLFEAGADDITPENRELAREMQSTAMWKLIIWFSKIDKEGNPVKDFQTIYDSIPVNQVTKCDYLYQQTNTLSPLNNQYAALDIIRSYHPQKGLTSVLLVREVMKEPSLTNVYDLNFDLIQKLSLIYDLKEGETIEL